ncbi:hypothetical protein PMIN02_012975, partial [Paraphaeosphaeria minitans]
PPPPPPPTAAPRAPSRSTPPPPPPAPPSKAPQDDDDDDHDSDDDDEYDPYKYTSTPPKPPSAPAPAPPAPKALINGTPSLAEQAARNAFGRSSPAAAPPPPPSSAPAPPPPPMDPPARSNSQAPLRSMLDPSSYTLTNGGAPSIKSPTNPAPGQKGKMVPVHDLRWRFVDESQFPRPREFLGGPKKYRAGRGSSVPLDLSAFE